jgi:hypothetical protein
MVQAGATFDVRVPFDSMGQWRRRVLRYEKINDSGDD